MMFGRNKADEVRPVDVAELRWTAGHSPDAVHVPLGRVGEAANRFAGQEVLTVCRSGARSGRAAMTLAAEGVGVRNVAGGMLAGAAACLPVVRDDGSPARVF